MRSTPEKVFEYFASVRTLAGEVFMTPADLMRATVPVPVFTPSESNRIIEIDREEFNKVMALMRAQNRQGARYKDGRLGQKAVSVENGGLLELEFSHCDHRSQGTISAKYFAPSLVASADINHINRLLNRVDEFEIRPQLTGIRITFEEFEEFAELRKKLQSFSLAIFSYGKVNGALTKNDFQRAASQVCGVAVTNNMVDIIFHAFDANRDGSLSVNEFVRVLQRRESDISQEGYRGLISCWLNCATTAHQLSCVFNVIGLHIIVILCHKSIISIKYGHRCFVPNSA
ncbi:Parvalbumin [Parasponia andersonii]|uniref:Parvalbumin n=1 Tax=Parasponia andersonii TaxID=3476 RepID=A0A2P5D5D9_PARAD|nr:Parvalbumin [Parasponia andersonii]